jgi:hypothetical protein
MPVKSIGPTTQVIPNNMTIVPLIASQTLTTKALKIDLIAYT